VKRKTIEIKARCGEHGRIREVLHARHAEFRGTDHQRDTYFSVPEGRLKLREGNIENALIFYDREEKPGPKESRVMLAPVSDGSSLKTILARLFGLKIVVEKEREIYFIQNVKFHLDRIADLGTFIEIEAIDEDGERSGEELMIQCRDFMKIFEIHDEDLLTGSYSDMLLGTNCVEPPV
jgi:adenylate cyclase class 2